MKWRGAMIEAALAAASGLIAAPATAQVPPSAAESHAYSGLHAAAQRGDDAAIASLARASAAALEARDPQGRTPLHVATFARQRGAINGLAPIFPDTVYSQCSAGCSS